MTAAADTHPVLFALTLLTLCGVLSLVACLLRRQEQARRTPPLHAPRPLFEANTAERATYVRGHALNLDEATEGAA